MAVKAKNKNATEPAPETKPKGKVKQEVAPNVELVAIITKYDESVSQAESYFIEFVEFIQENEVPRGEVVASLMSARGITFESAQSQYSRMKKIVENEEVLQELKDGKITLKVAREKTKTGQSRKASDSPEAKEKRFDKAVTALVASVKELGLSRDSVISSIEAELKANGVK